MHDQIIQEKFNNESFSYAVDEAMEKIRKATENSGQLPGLSTGINVIDNAIDGLQDSHLICVAGATGSGKTCLITNLAYNIADSHPVGFLSLEQPRIELVLRVISDVTGESLSNLKRGLIAPEKLDAIENIIAQIKHRRFYIRDSFNRQFDALKMEAAKLVDNFGIRALFIDYLQLAQGKDTRSRDREIGEITGGLKALAIELNIPVIIASQINREAQKNEGKRPNLSNLRESGSIEMDSDVVLLLHRDYYLKQNKEPSIFDQKEYQKYLKELDECHGKADLIVAKNRHGPSGDTLKLAFDEKRMRFTDLSSDQEVPE